MRRALVLALVGACGRVGFSPVAATGDGAISDGDGALPAAFVPYWHSGSRLRAHVFTGDGDPIFNGWHDALLDTDCQATVSADGSERCMPLAEGDTWYSDAACTQRLGAVYPGSCKHDTYATAFINGQAHAFPILPAVYTGPIYRDVGGGSCVTDNPPAELHMLGAEVPASMFVSSDYSTQMHGSYTELTNVYGDGASYEMRSITFNQGSCAPVANDLGPAPCRSATRRAVLVYLDGVCTQPGLLWARQSYDPPQVTQLNVFKPQACDMDYDLYDVVADVTGPTYYMKNANGGCASFTTPTGAILYTATKTTNPYPIGTVVRGPRRGRLGRLYWIAPDGTPFDVGAFDQDIGAPCKPFVAADGVVRCLQAQVPVQLASPDATCAGAPKQVEGECFGVAPVDGPSYSSCVDTPWTMHALPSTFPASVVDDGTCTQLPGTYADPNVSGSELPPSMFAPLIDHIE